MAKQSGAGASELLVVRSAVHTGKRTPLTGARSSEQRRGTSERCFQVRGVPDRARLQRDHLRERPAPQRMHLRQRRPAIAPRAGVAARACRAWRKSPLHATAEIECGLVLLRTLLIPDLRDRELSLMAM